MSDYFRSYDEELFFGFPLSDYFLPHEKYETHHEKHKKTRTRLNFAKENCLGFSLFVYFLCFAALRQSFFQAFILGLVLLSHPILSLTCNICRNKGILRSFNIRNNNISTNQYYLLRGLKKYFMTKLIDINSSNIKSVINILLSDKTTKKNIIWATSEYIELGGKYTGLSQITTSIINNSIIQPRICKSVLKQSERTKSYAEVFTPSWICNKMNNICDEEWFGYKDVFNTSEKNVWIINNNKPVYPEGKTWKDYVNSLRIEITCGEAPYLVSRYDASTGTSIEIKDRIGILDRKLRVVCDNSTSEEEWIEWAITAFQSVYGYEYQGDNLLIARVNLLMTFIEYLDYKWQRKPTDEELQKIADIISWNIWQMDGLTGTVPLGVPEEEFKQASLFDFTGENYDKQKTQPRCKIYDWNKNKTVIYNNLKKEGNKK